MTIKVLDASLTIAAGGAGEVIGAKYGIPGYNVTRPVPRLGLVDVITDPQQSHMTDEGIAAALRIPYYESVFEDGFESGIGLWQEVLTSGAAASITAFDGAQGCNIVTNAVDEGIVTRSGFALLGGQSLLIQFAGRATVVPTVIRAQLQFYDDRNVLISVANLDFSLAAANTWELFGGSAYAPSRCASCKIALLDHTGNRVVFFDSVAAYV